MLCGFPNPCGRVLGVRKDGGVHALRHGPSLERRRADLVDRLAWEAAIHQGERHHEDVASINSESSWVQEALNTPNKPKRLPAPRASNAANRVSIGVDKGRHLRAAHSVVPRLRHAEIVAQPAKPPDAAMARIREGSSMFRCFVRLSGGGDVEMAPARKANADHFGSLPYVTFTVRGRPRHQRPTLRPTARASEAKPGRRLLYLRTIRRKTLADRRSSISDQNRRRPASIAVFSEMPAEASKAISAPSISWPSHEYTH